MSSFKIKSNSKGFTLIELIVIIALMMILVGGAIVGISIISSGNAKKASQTIRSTLNEVRTSTLSIQAEWQAKIYNEDGTYKISVYRDGEESSNATLGTRITITFKDSKGSEIELKDNEELVITYKTSSGMLKSIEYGEKDEVDESIKTEDSTNCKIVSSSNRGDYVIYLWYDTGKTTTD